MFKHALKSTTRAITNTARRTVVTSKCNPTLEHKELTTPRILITGSSGQIGCDLTVALRAKYGVENVIATDIKLPPKTFPEGPFEYLDVMDYDAMAKIVVNNNITWIIHLASLLSAVGERNPQFAMKLNTTGIENALEIARNYNLRIFSPSSIAAFGPSTPRINTPDSTIQRPSTIYGVTKVYLELLGEYYKTKYGVDFRSIRYPGVISSSTMPGGGTTDYAVDIYHQALLHGKYTCFLKDDTAMPMIYGPDTIKATVDLLEADVSRLSQCTYNVQGCSFTPKQVYESIKKRIPDFEITYEPDFRQSIADSWPASIDDSIARKDWDWNPEYDLERMTDDMIAELNKYYNLDGSKKLNL